MATDPNSIVQEAVDAAISERGEIGLQVAAYVDGKQVVDVWGGLADATTGRQVDADTLFPVFSVTKAVTAVALHIQAERGVVDYATPIAHYWPEFGAHGKDKATVYDALTHRLGVPIMPLGVMPELMCDWDWMVQRIADMRPLFEPGTKAAYMSYTFGWVIGEVVRRTDPRRRPFGTFIQEEICQPLGLDSLWVGIPDAVEPRVATLTNMPPIPPGAPGMAPGALSPLAIPPQVGTTQEVFGRADVRRACLPGAGGIMNARSTAGSSPCWPKGGRLMGCASCQKSGCARSACRVRPVITTTCKASPTTAASAGSISWRALAMRPHPCRWLRRGGTRVPLAILVLVDRSGGRIPTLGWRSPLPTTGCSEPPRLRRTPLCRLARR